MGRLDLLCGFEIFLCLLCAAKPQIAKCHQIIAVRLVPGCVVLIKDLEFRKRDGEVLDLYLIGQMPLPVVDQAVEPGFRLFCRA